MLQGIWRLPASDVDRAGSFASHMSRCVTLLMEVLMDTGDHRTLLEICLQLQKTPEADKYASFFCNCASDRLKMIFN